MNPKDLSEKNGMDRENIGTYKTRQIIDLTTSCSFYRYKMPDGLIVFRKPSVVAAL